MLQPILDLFSGTAYRPDVINREATLRARMAGKTVLVASFNQDTVRYGVVTFGKKGAIAVSEVGTSSYDLNRVLEQFPLQQLTALSKKFRTSSILVGVGGAWLASPSETRYGGDAVQRNRALFFEPSEVIGNQIQVVTSMAYGVISNPKRPQSLVFTFPKPVIEEIVQLLEQRGFDVCRVQSSCFSVVDYVIGREYDSALNGRDFMVVDFAGIFFMTEDENAWGYPSFASTFDATKDETVRERVRELLARRENQSKPLTYVNTTRVELDSLVEGLVGDRGAVRRILGNVENFDLVALASDSTPENVGVDLNPVAKEPRPHINPAYRLMSYGSVAAALFMAAATGLTLKSNQVIIEDTAALVAQKKDYNESAAKIDAELARANADKSRAERLAAWVGIHLNLQPIVVMVMDSLPADVSADQLQVRLVQGDTQMEISVLLRGKTDACYAAIDEMLRRLQDIDIKLVTGAPAGDNGGVRFVGRFRFPAPNRVKQAKSSFIPG